MVRIALAAPLALLVFASAAAQPPAPLTPDLAKPDRIRLEQIMADPGWIGAPVENAYWAVDGKSVYYDLKRSASPIHDLHRIDLADAKDSVVDAAAMASADGNATVYDEGGTRAAFVRNGDIFLREISLHEQAGGRLTQVTRTPEAKSAPQFSADGRRLSFRAGHDWWVYDIGSGVTSAAAVLKAAKDPDATPKPDELHDMQLRIFSTLQKIHTDKNATREHDKTMQRDDATRAPLPFWLGDDVQIIESTLSPDTRWLLSVTAPKSHDEGKKGKLTRYVTESGYEEFEDERTRVGLNDPAPQTLWLFDLTKHTSTKLVYDSLAGIHDDPLKAVREENAKAGESAKRNLDKQEQDEKDQADKSEKEEKSHADGKPKQRELQISSVEFSRDGANAAVQLHANDNKDRWIASVDFARRTLVPQHRLTDPAWINWSFNEFGWERDNRTLWYVSEESGYAHLYTKMLGGKAQALTHGAFEVSHPQTSADGRWFYLRANTQAPYAYDIYRVPTSGGALQRITRYQGAESFALSHDGVNLLITHSASYIPPQIAVVAADGSGTSRELSDTRTAQYKALSWVAPQIVRVASTHFKGAIYAKFYKPENFDKSARHPAVMFVHGAGYTQNVHEMFPYYFREQMFHNMLLQHGYLVLDMDYRASEGYGRDWRGAIYRQMGHPELDDLLDGKGWLVQNWNVDPKRVGIYGGSYGGFMTLMALFRAPGEFAAGAALRPVTDWTQYNDDYTADILNRPQVDPVAYKRSSPIEFADGLKDALLICHGVLDDNVLFADSMRLYQRLIELQKDNFTISPYPLDRHGFTNADSWLDEYKRIYRLFEANLKAP